jgi:hypothetical protein
MQIRTIIGALGLIALALGGCKGDAPAASDVAPPAPAPAAPPDTTTAPAPDTAAAPTPDIAAAPAQAVVAVKLLDAGAEPRQVLRLKLAAGATDALDVEVQLDEKMRLSGRDLPNPSPPRVRLTVATKVSAVADDGVASYDLSVSKAEVQDLEAAPGPAQRLMPQVLEAIRGVSVAARVTADGRTDQAPYPRPTTGTPQVQALVASYLQALQNLAVPLPTEPIGVGGRWQVEQHIQQGRIAVLQTLVYEIMAIDGDVVQTRVTTTQAIDLAAAAADLPAGATVKSLEGTGTGEKTLELTRVLPTSAHVQVHSVASVELARPQGEPGSLQVIMDALLKAGPAIAAPDLPTPPPPAPEAPPADEHDHDGHDHGHE